MAAAGGNKVSTNMWALLANNDPGDSEEAAAMASRRLHDGEANKDRQVHAPSGGGEPPESSGVISGAAPKHGRKDKKASNRKLKKQQQPAAVANGEHKNQKEMTAKGPAPAPEVSTEVEVYDDGSGGGYSLDKYDSDEEDEGGAAGDSCCRRLLRRLFRTAVLMVAVAVVLKSAGTAGSPT